jgi:hypothetical protein
LRDRCLLGGWRLDLCLLEDRLLYWGEIVSKEVVGRTCLHRLVHGDHIVEKVAFLSASLRELVNGRYVGRRCGW